MTLLPLIALMGLMLAGEAWPEGRAGVAEIDRLLKLHPLAGSPFASDGDALLGEVPLAGEAQGVLIAIPGFRAAGCPACHEGEALLESVAGRVRQAVSSLKKKRPDLGPVPLRQVIVQLSADSLLRPGQLAHTTFDTIRLFPSTLIIDSKVYGGATLEHEAMHLAQSFLGPANELEAYSLNVLDDPRFLFLNYPYFEQVIRHFFVADFARLMDAFFARPTQEKWIIPGEVQWFLDEYDAGALTRVARAIDAMRPLIEEASRLNREHPLEAAYLSEQTGVGSLLLDIAAARQLPPLPVEIDAGARKAAFAVLADQFGRNDNTRLGYRIDRRREALLFLEHQVKLKQAREREALYFAFLKERFVGQDGAVDLTPKDGEDFRAYLEGKLAQVKKLLAYEGMTETEKEAGRRFIARIEKIMPARGTAAATPAGR